LYDDDLVVVYTISSFPIQQKSQSSSPSESAILVCHYVRESRKKQKKEKELEIVLRMLAASLAFAKSGST
jgi:hypothetical protein